MIKILSGEMAIELHLQFLIRNNNTDLMILKNTKVRNTKIWIFQQLSVDDYSAILGSLNKYEKELPVGAFYSIIDPNLKLK